MSIKVQEQRMYSTTYKQQINQKQPQKDKKTRKTRVRWSKVQDLKYFLFLFHHKNRFIQSDIRRSLRMFKQMALFMKTRDASQCRVRHLKLVRKYQGIEASLQFYINSHPQFTEKYNKIKHHLQILEDNLYFGDFHLYESIDQKVQKIETEKNHNILVKAQNPIVEQNKNMQVTKSTNLNILSITSTQIKQQYCKVQQEQIYPYHFYQTPGMLFQTVYYK